MYWLVGNVVTKVTPKSSNSEIDCFFKTSTRLTEIPTQVICQCIQMDHRTSKPLQTVSTEKPLFSKEEFGKLYNDTPTDK